MAHNKVADAQLFLIEPKTPLPLEWIAGQRREMDGFKDDGGGKVGDNFIGEEEVFCLIWLNSIDGEFGDRPLNKFKGTSAI